METWLPWRHTRGSLSSLSYLVWNPTLAPQLEKTNKIPPSSRDEMSDSVRPYGLQPVRQDGIISFLWFKMESKLLHIEDHVLPTSKLCGFTLLLNYFILGDSKITADGDCSHEIKRRLLLGRKAMTNLDSILKSRDITLPTKVHLVKAMVFVVDVYQCESRNIKKAECQSIDVFELWCWKDSWESLGLQGDPTSPS